ncbi:hypothetical protein P7C70_g9621, partial [Phenoliferia sp. Uapishka_3]
EKEKEKEKEVGRKKRSASRTEEEKSEIGKEKSGEEEREKEEGSTSSKRRRVSPMQDVETLISKSSDGSIKDDEKEQVVEMEVDSEPLVDTAVVEPPQVVASPPSPAQSHGQDVEMHLHPDDTEEGETTVNKDGSISTSAPRAKHPNQYTYRPKPAGPPPPKPTRASPTKRVGANGNGHAHTTTTHTTTTAQVPPFHAATNSGRTASASHALGPSMYCLPVEQSGWGLPDHLRHLSHLLPSMLPAPLNVPIPSSASALPIDDSNTANGESGEVEITPTTKEEPPTRVKFPNKRMTLPEMKKRAKVVLEYLARIQIEMSEKDRREEVLRGAVEAGLAKSG